MKIFILSVLITLAFTSARAQLGQTEEATTAAYGKPLTSKVPMGSTTKAITFRTDAYDIIAGIKEGKTVYLICKKRTGSSWSDAEIKSLLESQRLGNDKWHWSKDIITGRHGPAVHQGNAKHINEAEHWHIFAHDDYAAEYYPEKTLLLIWDASSGADSESILHDNMY